jgi:CTP:phosphocholine cytidylyltransferase-like protein
MTKLLILAAGQGSRNNAFTFNGTMPKCLMSVGKETVIEAIINSYQAIDLSEIVVVCQSKHQPMIEAILTYKKIEVPIVYHILDELLGTAGSVLNVLTNRHTFDVDWFINWSDVYSDITYVPEKTCIFTDSNLQHRNYAFHTIRKQLSIVSTGLAEGNVPGIFYVKANDAANLIMSSVLKSNDFDAVLVGLESGTVSLNNLESVTDIGDYEKYAKLRTKSSETGMHCRYFNNIEVERDCVKKSPRTEEGIKLHNIELSYYRKFAHGTAFAKLLSYDRSTKTMSLEKISGRTCQAYYDSKTKEAKRAGKVSQANELMAQFMKAIATIHNVNPEPIQTEKIRAAIFDEFLHAVKRRVEPLQVLIESVIKEHNITSVNGMPITKDFGDLYRMLSEFMIVNADKCHYGVTHGDPNTDNCLIDSDGEVRLIDPRGYFGSGDWLPLGHGIIEYDYAKFLYGLSGYSRFNSADYVAVDIKDGNIINAFGLAEDLGIEQLPLSETLQSLDGKLDTEHARLIRVLVGIIWLKLTAYIINDPVKSVLAYLHGNAIITSMLKS